MKKSYVNSHVKNICTVFFIHTNVLTLQRSFSRCLLNQCPSYYISPQRPKMFGFSLLLRWLFQLEKSVCMGAMLWSKAAYWESPVLASFSCCAAWESWNAASGWAESGNMVHSLSSRSATPFSSSQKPKAKAAFRRRFSSWHNKVQSRNFHFEIVGICVFLCQTYFVEGLGFIR